MEPTSSDQLALVILVLTASVNEIMGRTPEFGARGLAAEPIAVMGQTEERVRTSLAQVVEHYDDEEIEYVLNFLDGVVLGLAEPAGTLHLFRKQDN